MEEEKKRKINLASLFIILFVLLVILIAIIIVINQNKIQNANNLELSKNSINEHEKIEGDEINKTEEPEEVGEVNLIIEKIKDNNFSNFDLNFLKLENRRKNIVYSPLSIKYALKMLEEATDENSKEQISNILGKYNITRYTSNKNMALANSLFVRESFKNDVKNSYINNIKEKYKAEVIFDSFNSAKTINDWIDKNTLNIISNIITDDELKELDFTLINVSAIDMDWKEKFIMGRGWNTYPSTEYLHEKGIFVDKQERDFEKKKLNVYDIDNVSSNVFVSNNREIEISGMNIYATINNYDIIKELGEENIKTTVSNAYKKWIQDEINGEFNYEEDSHVVPACELPEDTSNSATEKYLQEFLPTYLSELKKNYHKSGSSTDFSLFVDEDVKVFAKDLDEYNGTTLQYIGIMPVNVELKEFIKDLNSETINNYINNLKNIRYQDFKEGIATCIYGFIPKFNFEYDLDLMNDLKANNIEEVFDKNANMSNLTDAEGANISKVLHKANIEFTQDGIKAAAATFIGGAGGGNPFDYIYDVPVEEIDLTFDKPYMFLIRDKKTGETWFAGTVYEPLLWENEPENDTLNY